VGWFAMSDVDDKTMMFKIKDEKAMEIHQALLKVYDALSDKGYNPINQIVGYLMSGDPAYITSHNNARGLIRVYERDEIIEAMVKEYIK
jgi:uncharacterized protein (UPF0297 family)